MFARAMPWLGPAAVVLALSAVLPPVASYARQYAFVQALQFVIFAIAAPALLILGLRSWSARRDARGRVAAGGRWRAAASSGLLRLARLPGGRPDADRQVLGAAAARLLPFVALVILWRLPGVLDALARYPALAVAEMVSLLCAGSAIWSELIAPAPPRRALPRPLRGAMATVAMWTIWAIAYLTGMAGTAATLAVTKAPPALNAATDQQIAVAVLWAVPAICFTPVVYAMIIEWLGERDDPDAELRAATLSHPVLTELSPQPRPPRGWRSPAS